MQLLQMLAHRSLHTAHQIQSMFNICIIRCLFNMTVRSHVVLLLLILQILNLPNAYQCADIDINLTTEQESEATTNYPNHEELTTTATLVNKPTSKTPNGHLEWKKVPPAWISPSIIWKILGFPVSPNLIESQTLLLEEDVPLSHVNLTHYNVSEESGIIIGELNCECGIPATPRIVGVDGEPARINDIPWTAAMVFKASQQPFCGASLINDRYLLTAGHCVALGKRTNASEIEIWMNDDTVLLSHDTVERRIVYEVEKIIIHPHYKVYYNDIALIKLKERVPLGENQFYLLNPICLPKDNEETFAGKTGTVAGWGRTSAGGSTSPILLKIDVPIHSNEKCVAESKYKGSVKENMMCAGDMLHGGRDSCQGDSGGPLMVKEYERIKLAGLVSWGWGCAEPYRPGVYTRVGVYPEWILENTKDAEWCQVKLSKNRR